MLMLVVFCYFGTFHSAVQAQISSNNDPTESLAPPNFEPNLSINNRNSNLETTTQNVLYQQIQGLISKLSNEIEIGSEGKEYESRINLERFETDKLRNEIAVSTVHAKALARKPYCRMKKLCQLERKLNNTNVAFLFQRNGTYKKPGTIPFSIMRLNTGGGFNSKTGVFNAPVPGIYHLYFSGLKTKAEEAGTSSLIVQLKKTSKSKKEILLAEGHINSQDKYGWFPVNVQATVALKKGDDVHVHLVEGSLYGSGSEAHLVTEFGGFLTRPFKEKLSFN